MSPQRIASEIERDEAWVLLIVGIIGSFPSDYTEEEAYRKYKERVANS